MNECVCRFPVISRISTSISKNKVRGTLQKKKKKKATIDDFLSYLLVFLRVSSPFISSPKETTLPPLLPHSHCNPIQTFDFPVRLFSCKSSPLLLFPPFFFLLFYSWIFSSTLSLSLCSFLPSFLFQEPSFSSSGYSCVPLIQRCSNYSGKCEFLSRLKSIQSSRKLNRIHLSFLPPFPSFLLSFSSLLLSLLQGFWKNFKSVPRSENSGGTPIDDVISVVIEPLVKGPDPKKRLFYRQIALRIMPHVFLASNGPGEDPLLDEQKTVAFVQRVSSPEERELRTAALPLLPEVLKTQLKKEIREELSSRKSAQSLVALSTTQSPKLSPSPSPASPPISPVVSKKRSSSSPSGNSLSSSFPDRPSKRSRTDSGREIDPSPVLSHSKTVRLDDSSHFSEDGLSKGLMTVPSLPSLDRSFLYFSFRASAIDLDTLKKDLDFLILLLWIRPLPEIPVINCSPRGLLSVGSSSLSLCLKSLSSLESLESLHKERFKKERVC